MQKTLINNCFNFVIYNVIIISRFEILGEALLDMWIFLIIYCMKILSRFTSIWLYPFQFNLRRDILVCRTIIDQHPVIIKFSRGGYQSQRCMATLSSWSMYTCASHSGISRRINDSSRTRGRSLIFLNRKATKWHW